MTTEETYGWEITIESDQKCFKPRLKVRDGHFPTEPEMQQAVDALQLLSVKIAAKGYKVAPL